MEHQRSNTQIFRYSLTSLFTLLLSCLLFSCTLPIQAQTTSSDKKAIKLFEEAQGYYQALLLESAKSSLLKAIERDPKFVEAHTLLAYVYIDSRENEKAKQSFETAISFNPTLIPNNLFFLARIELYEGNYEKAEKLYRQFITIPQAPIKQVRESEKQLDNIAFALQAIQNPYPFEPINMGPNINSELSEYFPSITVDEKMLLFTRRLPEPGSPMGYNEDFFVSQKVGGEWQKAVNIGPPITTKMNEGAPSLAANGQLMIFAACEIADDYGQGREGKGSCDLFYSVQNDQQWTRPINLGSTVNTGNWETQPSFSADGKSLYFIKGKRGVKGFQDGNIFITQLEGSGGWSKPVPLNNNINTLGNEESVLIHPDGQTLYFSSDGHPGMGGLDIFMSKRDKNGEWGPAVNLGYPINSHRNENSLLVSPNGKIAFFASDREGGLGELDLYQFDLPKEFAPNKITYFAGKIFDQKTNKPLGARFELIDLETEEIVVEAFSNNLNGEFLVTLPTGKNYALNASKSGYLFYSENFSLENYTEDKPFIQNVPLRPIAEGEKIILKNIFFETAKYDLKSQSKAELNKLVAFLRKNENLKIEISGHTDNTGSTSSNLLLSQNRAKAVRSYLINTGNISADRLTSKGFGSSQPIADNETEEGKAKNRRTEFQIIGL